MFRYSYKEKNSINGFILMMVALLCTTALIFVHNNVTDREDEPQTIVDSTSMDLRPTSKSEYINHPRAKRLPQAIIVGARKSGTRALLKFLELNPAIRVANKEIHFFDKPQNYNEGLDWYRKQMPVSSLSDITIEKSPAYFVTPGVAEKVNAMNSSIKLVLILRDPVTRLISDFSQIVANKIEAIEDEEDAGGRDYGNTIVSDGNLEHSDAGNSTNSAWIKAEKEFEEYVLRPDGGINDQRRAIKIGMYSVYLEKWLSIFPMSQFHFVDGETLIKNPYKELHELEIFFDLEPMIRPENFVFNTKKGFYCLAAQNSSKVVNSQDGLKDFHKQVYRSSDGAISNITSAQPICLSRSKGRRHVAVRKELIEELQKFYAPYNEYLFSLIGKNFDW